MNICIILNPHVFDILTAVISQLKYHFSIDLSKGHSVN